MNEKLIFFSAFIKNFKTIGSIIPSSKFLAKRVSQTIKDLNVENKVILEIGAGTGVFSRELLKSNEIKSLDVIEMNNNFFKYLFKLKDQNPHKIPLNIHFINFFTHKTPRKYSIVLSGVPLNLLSPKDFDNFLDRTADLLTDDGFFVFFEYLNSPLLSLKNNKLNKLRKKRVLKKIEVKNFPPAQIVVVPSSEIKNVL